MNLLSTFFKPLCFIAGMGLSSSGGAAAEVPENFRPGKLAAWCIVPFDAAKRGPAARAAMLEELGIGRLAYDWRAEPKPDFEGEILEMKKRGIEFFAFWGESAEAFALFEKHGMHPQIWVIPPSPEGGTREERVAKAARELEPLVKRTEGMGCAFGLYNHGGWGGEPENLVAICERLREMGYRKTGIVYNWHHGHEHIKDWEVQFERLRPYLLCLNLNGMTAGGNPKIQSLSQGGHELAMLKVVLESGYDGPVGILNHREEMDAREALRQNLVGLEWLLKEAVKPGSGGEKPDFGKKPVFVPSDSKVFGKAWSGGISVPGKDGWREPPITVECRVRLEPGKGYQVMLASDPKTSDAHWEIFSMDGSGTLTAYLPGAVPDHIHSKAVINDGKWHTVAMRYAKDRVDLWVDGERVADEAIRMKEGERRVVPGKLGIGSLEDGGFAIRGEIDEVIIRSGIREGMEKPRDKPHKPGGEGELGYWNFENTEGLDARRAAPDFPREPLEPELNPYWKAEINRDRVYDFYAKQALQYSGMKAGDSPDLIPAYPGLDGGKHGHWGNQNDAVTWREPRVKEMEYGSMVSGVFNGAGLQIPRAVTVSLEGGFHAVFDEDKLMFRAAWKGEAVEWNDIRRGIMNGIPMGKGETVGLENAVPPSPKAKFLGLHRRGQEVYFSYRDGGKTFFRAVSVSEGKVLERVSETLPNKGKLRWPGEIETKGKLGEGNPYAIDTLTLPYENPWKSLFYLAGVEFLSDSRIAVCTFHGDVWICDASGPDLAKLRWRRFAAGLNQPLGLKMGKDDGVLHVMCRDQLVALHDRDGDGEADFYECVSNVHETSVGAHDFITGLEQDNQGRWYFASANQGICRLSPDGEKLEVLGTGLRNPNGLAVSADGSVVLSNVQEGDWTPASAICDISRGGHHGAGGPKDGKRVPPMLLLPRGVDNSCGGQVYIDSERWGSVKGQWVHFSNGAAKAFLILREQTGDGSQAVAIPLSGEFLSGSHRGRFSPDDGQLYVASAQGWACYGVADGALQRVRFTGKEKSFPYPNQSEIRENGILLSFADPQPESITEAGKWFAQQWNYHYGPQYGSPEYSVKSPGIIGHDRLEIRSVQRLEKGRKVFLEIPQIQPVDQLHLHWMDRDGSNRRLEAFATVNQLGKAFTDFPGYVSVPKIVMNVKMEPAGKEDGAMLMQACVACHHPSEIVMGPSLSEIRKKYAGNPEGIVKWAMNPQKSNPNLPPMPSFKYLGEKKLGMIAKEILSVK